MVRRYIVRALDYVRQRLDAAGDYGCHREAKR
jgi:hypothetical protein